MDAKDVIEKIGVSNPFSICNALNIKIKYIDIEDIKGAVVKFFNTTTILLNNNLEGFNKYFILSHELCHAINHDFDEVKMFKDNSFYQTDRYEIEANKFAIELLLENCDISDIQNIDDDIKKVLTQHLSLYK